MIVSHKHKFIFIKTRKTAGTSIEQVLLKLCGDDDIITLDHIHSGEEDILANDARNYDGRWLPLRELVSCSSLADAGRLARDWLKWPKFYNHMSAVSVKSRIPSKVWNSYYKFCFERNSWDKAVSFYFWQKRFGNNLGDFNEFILDKRGGNTIDRAMPKDWRRYTHKNQIIVDDVFQFSELDAGLSKALANVGISDFDLSIPRIKSGLRKDSPTFSAAASDRVRKIFEQEIRHFDYECPDALKGYQHS